MASVIDKISATIQNIPSKTRIIGFGVFLLTAAGLFIYFVHIPKTTQIAKLEKDVARLHAKIKANDEKIKKLDALKQEVKTLQDKLRLLTAQLPPGSEVSGLLRQIQNLVSQSGLSLKIWRPRKRKTHASGLYEEIPISIELTGGYHDVGLFLDRVSKLIRIVNVFNMKMGSATRGKAKKMNIKVSCTAMTFAAVEKKQNAVPAKKAR